MNISKQTFSTLLLALAATLSFLLPGQVSAQSNISTVSVAPVIMPLQAKALDADELLLAPTERESYAASYPGGSAELTSFLKLNVEYPELARDNNFEGTTVVRFEVLANGELGRYVVQQSTHDICDQEVIKALKQTGNWVPAKLYGKKVASWHSVYVDFKMTF